MLDNDGHNDNQPIDPPRLPAAVDRLALELAKRELQRAFFGTLHGGEIRIDFSRPVWPDPSEDAADPQKP